MALSLEQRFSLQERRIRHLESALQDTERRFTSQDSDDEAVGTAKRVVISGEDSYIRADGYTYLKGRTPYITLHNSTTEDASGGRESRIIARGTQSGGEESTLGYLEFFHIGSGDDEDGGLRLLLNHGSDGDSPSAAWEVIYRNSIEFQMNLFSATKTGSLRVEENTGDLIIDAGQDIKFYSSLHMLANKTIFFGGGNNTTQISHPGDLTTVMLHTSTSSGDNYGSWIFRFNDTGSGSRDLFEIGTVNDVNARVRVGTGTASAHAELTIGDRGVFCFIEAGTPPTADSGYGKIWTAADNELYFQDGAGVTHNITGGAPVAHTHDGDTLQLDGVNSDGGAFAFDTTGDVAFSQGVGVGVTPTYKLSVGSADNSDQVGIYHDNTDGYIVLTDGALYVTNSEADTNMRLRVIGNGTGNGGIDCYDEDQAEYVGMYSQGGVGRIVVDGSSPTGLTILHAANADVSLFTNAASGETRELKIHGYRTGDSNRSLEIGVGVDAADTASFDGVSLYQFDGFVRAASAGYRRYYHLTLSSLDPGASGATWVDADANQLDAWNLDADGETLRTQTDVHSDWDGASDISVELPFTIPVDNSGGAAPDVVRLVLVAYYKSAGQTATRTQTITDDVVIGACAQYTQFTHTFVIPYDTGGQEVAAGDKMSLAIHMVTASSDVSDVNINEGSFFYNTTHVGIESGDA